MNSVHRLLHLNSSVMRFDNLFEYYKKQIDGRNLETVKPISKLRSKTKIKPVLSKDINGKRNSSTSFKKKLSTNKQRRAKTKTKTIKQNKKVKSSKKINKKTKKRKNNSFDYINNVISR